MTLQHILVLGAGPAGLSAALALSQMSRAEPSLSPPLRVTVLELRPEPATLGGTINLTPLGLRYLDRLGVGPRLRPLGVRVRAIDMISLRTGARLGSLWDGVDALRVRRAALVDALLETCRDADHAATIEVRFGVRVTAIAETGEPEGDGRVVLQTADSGTIEGDVLIGADGIHSIARSLYVEPSRVPVYTGRAAAACAIPCASPGEAPLTMADGSAAVRDTTLFQGQAGSLLASFGDTARRTLHLGVVLGVADVPSDAAAAREGWRVRDGDKAAVRADVLDRFRACRVPGVREMLEAVVEWTLYPVYGLAPHGRWSRGRVIIIGDAAHAMPPQGESTGVAIEDGVLLARVFERHGTRTVARLFADYEALRRQTIEKLYKETTWRWNNAASHDSGWLWSVFIDYLTVAFLWFMKLRQGDYFASDVARLELPA